MDYKISFCITCMNRLKHIQETLSKNIEDNYRLGEVEFVLLDYNSLDGLENWVKSYMKKYIDLGLLSYYKTFLPHHYLRSHSRNVAFRLAKGNIVCNLDADNFLGKGFADEMIKEFEKKMNIFYTSDLQSTDVYGRVCLLKKDFMAIRGYDESLTGYGHEDVDLFSRLEKYGLEHLYYKNQNFNNAIKHSKFERVNNEPIFNKLLLIYISYINPYTSEILLIYNDYTFETGILVDTNLYKLTKATSKSIIRENNKIILKNNVKKGSWKRKSENIMSLLLNKEEIVINENNKSFIAKNAQHFYQVIDEELKISIIILISMALNEKKSISSIDAGKKVNMNGFGECTVYENFDSTNSIILK